MRFCYTMEPRYNEPLYNEVLGIANYSDYPSNSNTYMTKNLDITKPCYCKTNFASPLALVTWRFFFKCITITWVIKRVCYTLWTSLNRGFHCIIFSFQLLTDLGPSNLTSSSPLLIYYIYILPQPHYLLFDPPLPTWLITSFCSRFSNT